MQFKFSRMMGLNPFRLLNAFCDVSVWSKSQIPTLILYSFGFSAKRNRGCDYEWEEDEEVEIFFSLH